MFWAPPDGPTGNFTPTAAENMSLALFNAHPEWPMNVILPFGREFHNQSLPNGCYLQVSRRMSVCVCARVQA